MKNILIAYYSWSGNTRSIAEQIHGLVGGTLFEIQPVKPYPKGYNACVNQAKKEIKAGHRPPLVAMCANMESYDVIFVGSPNWWSTIAPPVATFLDSTSLSGKIVAPFCSHGGGGAGRVESDIAKLCPTSVMREGLFVYGRGATDIQPKIAAWVQEVMESSPTL
ncbi:MAG: flavodoxin [Firmicutes bacterium]|nr:flavodoxin [Bacillota bacterium]